MKTSALTKTLAAKALRSVIACLLLVACSQAAPQGDVAPPPAGVWANETGTAAFNYGVYGWDVLRLDATAPEHLVFSISNPSLKDETRYGAQVRACNVWETPFPLPDLGSQEQMNAFVNSRTAADLTTSGDTVSELSHTTINGVAVVSFRSDSGADVQFVRLFYTRANQQTTQVMLSCGGTPPFSDQTAQNFTAVLNSLQLGAGAAERAAHAPTLPPPPPVATVPAGASRSWSAPNNAFTLSVADTWTRQQSGEYTAYGQELLTASAPARAGAHNASGCTVRMLRPRSPLSAFDQASLNTYYEHRRGAGIDNGLVGGVRVMTVTRQSEGYFSGTSIFLIPFEDNAREFNVECEVRAEMSRNYEQDVANADAMLKSLSFPRGAP